MKPGDARVYSVPTFSSDSAPRASTPVDRWVAGRIRASVASARLRFVLWDGFELPYAGDVPVATIVFKNRRALFSWVWDPELNFGEAYMFGAVEICGRSGGDARRDLSRAPAHQAARPWWLWQPSNDERAAQRERPSPLRPRQRLLPALARSRDALHVRVLPDAGRHARGGADREDGSRLPEAAAEAGRARRRGRLRLGLAGAVHGEALRRDGARVQHLDRADRVRARTGRRRRGSPTASSSSRTTTATCAASTTRSCRSACSSTSAWRTTRRSARVIDRSLDRRGPRAAALHRPEPAGAAQSVDPEAHLPRRLSADASARCSSACSSRGTCRCSTSRTCGCTTRRRSSTGGGASRPRRRRVDGCSTRRSSARGGCIWPARRPRSRPARCSCSRWSSRAARATRFRGRVRLTPERRHGHVRRADRRRRTGRVDLRAGAPSGRPRRPGHRRGRSFRATRSAPGGSRRRS